MEPNAERQWLDALSDLLNRSHLFQPDQLADALGATMAGLDISTTIYLVDDEQRALHPIPQEDLRTPEPAGLDDSLPGRVFRGIKTLPAPDGTDLWVPMVNGTDRLGVIKFTFGDDADAPGELTRRRCETMAGLAGHLITVTAPKGDFLLQVRRSRPMSTGGELLSHQLPPLTASCERLSVSAILEPCYDVGGDGFDYAIDGPMARLVVLDAVGRGLRAATICTVVMASIRAARRTGQDLSAQARAADRVIAEQFPGGSFATAVLAELNMDTGILRYTNAGHPAPLVLRSGHVVRELTAGRRLPLGLGGVPDKIAEQRMEPGDRLLLYTDGITEARDPACELFGVQRLADHAERHAAAGLPAAETLRRLARAVAAHQDGPARDDATMLLAEWSPDAARRSVP
ncbi:PP2C family protein-serine/threonine phosphatase [Paractinoplanes maris]|uniref:PP2C family protein-serine/threonine phosphatase n=1 Tax=Paractinoplanes maris TaxID=1734446 RepID=UPI0020216C8C|nr:PP2C family protein-serine/threonine phosphatase [Actinoplanes maris]